MHAVILLLTDELRKTSTPTDMLVSISSWVTSRVFLSCTLSGALLARTSIVATIAAARVKLDVLIIAILNSDRCW